MESTAPNRIHKALFYIAVIIPIFNNYELTFITWLLIAGITLRKTYSVTIAKYIGLSLLILLIAFISSFFSDFKTYNFIRDITYLLKPVLGLMIGYQVFKNIKDIKAFRIIVYAGFLLSIIHFILLFYGVIFLHIRNMHELRFHAGYFSDFEVYALVILLFAKKFELGIPKNKRIIFLLIVGFSVFLYLARTNFIQFGILAIAIMGYFRLTKKSLKTIGLTLIIVVLGYTAIYQSNPKRSASGFEAFLYKIKIAPIEPFKTKIDEDDWKDFNDNYRSFENIITVKQVSGQGTQKVLFGEGLGSSIDLGREMWTNDGEFIRFIPALHNSYMTIFLKSGLAGVFLMLIFIYFLLNQKKSPDPLITTINYLLVGSAVFLIVSNWVFMGLYFKVDNKSLILGLLICYKELLMQNPKRDQLDK